MKILIDGDASPVNKITINVANKFNLETIILSNFHHKITASDNVTVITVDDGSDSVDFALINKASSGDIIVTQDYGVGAMALGKKCHPIHPKGFLYTDDNISLMLERRHQSKKTKKFKPIKKRTIEDDIKFENTLTKLIEDIINL